MCCRSPSQAFPGCVLKSPRSSKYSDGQARTKKAESLCGVQAGMVVRSLSVRCFQHTDKVENHWCQSQLADLFILMTYSIHLLVGEGNRGSFVKNDSEITSLLSTERSCGCGWWVSLWRRAEGTLSRVCHPCRKVPWFLLFGSCCCPT